MIRVLIADDSATTLELLAAILASDRQLCVVGSARDGAAAVTLTKSLRPDVVVMDIHMPVLDGFRATQQIMIESPTPIVIVSATVDARSVDVSLRALELGALSVLEKPPPPTAADFEQARERFVSTVRAMAQVKVVRRWASAIVESRPLASSNQGASARMLAIAASTGGPSALRRILSEFPATLPVPVLIVQHMAPGFVSGLASWLGEGTDLKVQVAESRTPMENGVVYLAPDDHHLGVYDRMTLLVVQHAACGGFRPSATFLFESVAAIYGRSALGVILTGMGDDGTVGLRTLKQHGGRIIAQDEASSVVFGMPAAAIAAGLPDVTLPLHLIGARVQAWLRPSPQAERMKGSH